MASKDVSAGLMVFRRRGTAIEVLLAHPGGPFWAKKDAGAWTIPKGLVEGGDELLVTARHEFTEETGFVVDGPFTHLERVKQVSGKVVHAFACEGDFDAEKLVSNSFEIEWPPRSKRVKRSPFARLSGQDSTFIKTASSKRLVFLAVMCMINCCCCNRCGNAFPR